MKHPRKEQQFNQLKVLFIFNTNTASLLQYACQNVCKHLRAMTQWEDAWDTETAGGRGDYFTPGV